ncbi:MAG: M48 family metalloprotease [Candidatus Babeliales bacterium]
MFKIASLVFSILCITTTLSKNIAIAPDSTVQNSTITADQLKSKVEYMLTKVLGFEELPNIVVSDMFPGGGVANGPLYYAVNNTLFLPLNAVRSLGNWPSTAAALEPLFPRIRAKVIPAGAMSDEMILTLLAHEMAHFEHRKEILQFSNKEASKNIVAFCAAVSTVAGVYYALSHKMRASNISGERLAQVIGYAGGIFVGGCVSTLNMYRTLRSQKNYMTIEEAYADQFALELLEKRLPAQQAAECFEAIAFWFEGTYEINQAGKAAIKTCQQEQVSVADTTIEKFNLWLFDSAYTNALWQEEKKDGHMPLRERCELFRSRAEKLKTA